MRWEVLYFDQALQERVLSLPHMLLGKYLSLVDLLIEFGPGANIPQVAELGQDLYVLHVERDHLFVDVFYCHSNNNQIIILFENYGESASVSMLLTLLRKRQEAVSQEQSCLADVSH